LQILKVIGTKLSYTNYELTNMNSQKLHRILVFLVFFIIVALQQSYAQDGTIRGFVYEQETGEPVIFVNVYFKGTTYGSATDVNGFYAISKVPVGDYTLLVTYLGYDTLSMPVTIEEDDIISKNLFLKSSSVKLDVVKVSAERQEDKTEVKASVINITPKQISELPTIGGIPDIAQYLQVLPGVVFTGDQGGQLYIRGGTPIQNKTLLDGMVIYQPFHSIGIYSVFDTDILRNADVYTAGFNAEYGDRVSSVLDITTRDGNKKRLAGKVAASTIGAKLLIEGPIAKQKDPTKGSSSFLISARTSYLEQSSKVFYKYIDEDGLPFNFMDIYGKLSIHGANGSKINFFGFNFADNVNQFKSIASYGWDSWGMGANFVVIPGRSPVLLEGHFAYSDYKVSMKDEVFPNRESEINGFSLGLNFKYFMGKNTLQYGLELQGFKTDLLYINAANTVIDPPAEFTTQFGAFIKYKWILNKFIIEPGFRLQWYSTLSEVSPEPRLAIKYLVTDKFRLKLAGGLYSQTIISGTSDRDVVNLFYAFISGIVDHPPTFDGDQIKSEYQKAQHIVLGAEFDIGEHLRLNVEGYYKNFQQLFNINRNKIYNTDSDFIVEKGDAEGIDLTLKFDFKNFYIWTAYSFAFVNRYYEAPDGSLQHYYPHYDRRHNLNIVGVYKFGSNLNWETSVRWNFGSGLPFTQNQGFYEHINFSNGINTNYTTANGDLDLILADLNQGRLPNYMRLDADIKRKFYLSERSLLEINFSVTNIVNRENVFYVNRYSKEVIYQLPIMPALGVSLTF